MILHYREKNKIEEAFRDMKGMLALRPWFVYKESHLRAHYTICVLAYFLKKIIDKKLEFADVKSSAGLSVERLLHDLHSTKIARLTLGTKLKKTLLTPTDSASRNCLKALKMDHLLEIHNSLK